MSALLLGDARRPVVTCLGTPLRVGALTWTAAAPIPVLARRFPGCVIRLDQQILALIRGVDRGHSLDFLLGLRLRLGCLPTLIAAGRRRCFLLGFFVRTLGLITTLLILLGRSLDQKTLIMFGMLQEIFRDDTIAAGLRVTCQRQILVDHLLRCPTNLALGTGAVIDAVGDIPAAGTSPAAPTTRAVVLLC